MSDNNKKPDVLVKQVSYHFSTTENKNSDTDDIAALKSLFKIALQTRNFEINQLVNRNNFFMLFQGVLLAGFIQSSHPIPVVSFMICIAGLAVSILQTTMASGAKFWQEYWEYAVSEIESALMNELDQNSARHQLFSFFHDESDIYTEKVKKRLANHSNCSGLIYKLIMKKYSVSRIPIYIGISLSVVWFLLLLCTMRGYPPLSIPSFIVGFKI